MLLKAFLRSCYSLTLLTVTASVATASIVISADDRLIWRHPGNISSLDLTYGPGSAQKAPRAPFTYLEEDKDGESPKFKVRDANGVEWSVKMGPEAQSETVATRIVWAMGYFAEETYYFPRVEVSGLPKKLSRGMQYVDARRFVRNVRFEPRRDHIKRGDTWRWLKNPFIGTRELDGLKVLMVLLNNYDTSPANNRVLKIKNGSGDVDEWYGVTDLGASLGSVGGLGGRRSKSNLAHYQRSNFIKRVRGNMVEFNYNTTPSGFGYVTFVLAPWYWKSQADKEKAMKAIRVDHARWIGGLLAQLTDEQLRDAFRAAGYTAAASNGYISVIGSRVRELSSLTPTASYRAARSR